MDTDDSRNELRPLSFLYLPCAPRMDAVASQLLPRTAALDPLLLDLSPSLPRARSSFLLLLLARSPAAAFRQQAALNNVFLLRIYLTALPACQTKGKTVYFIGFAKSPSDIAYNIS